MMGVVKPAALPQFGLYVAVQCDLCKYSMLVGRESWLQRIADAISDTVLEFGRMTADEAAHIMAHVDGWRREQEQDHCRSCIAARSATSDIVDNSTEAAL